MQKKLILPSDTRDAEPTENSKVVPFLSPVPGGKDPTYDWLKNDIAEGQTFVCRRRPQQGQRQLLLDEFSLVNNRNKTFLLLTNLNQEAYVRVISAEFSRDMELVEVLGE